MVQNRKLPKIKTLLAVFVLTVACLLPAIQANAATLATPTGLKQTAATSTGIQYGWNPVAGATAYACSYSTDGKSWSNEVTTSGTLQIFNGLAAGKTYYVRTRAYNGTWSNWSTSFAVTTSPKACTTLKETAATENAVAVAWNAVEGVSGYNVWLGKGNESTKLIKTTASSTTALVIKGLTKDTKYTVEVVPFVKSPSGFAACADAKRNKSIVTMAGAVKGVKLVSWNSSNGDFSLKWKNSAKYENGYEIQLLTKNGKKFKSFFVKGKSATLLNANTKKLLSKGGKVRVRTYNDFSGVKSYGAWSKEVVIVPTATATATKISTNAVTVSWKKFSGAKSYTIYYSTQPNMGYHKLSTLGANVTSYTFSNLKPTSKYYVYIVANDVKIGKKKYKSTYVSVKSPVLVTVDPTVKQ